MKFSVVATALASLVALVAPGPALAQLPTFDPLDPVPAVAQAAPRGAVAGPAGGAAPAAAPRGTWDREISLGEVSVTPEMWFYQQEARRYDDPREMVRKKAEFRSAQRMARLASQEWYGYSKARPIASPTPFTGSYSPRWVGNTGDTNRWTGTGRSYIITRPTRYVGGVQGLW